jgi:hypothetical protein
MQTEPSEEVLGVPPSVMTAEFFTPDGKRYNFEQILIDDGSFVELMNGSSRIIFRFWQNRQSEKDYPVDDDSRIEYEKDLVNTVIPEPVKSYEETLLQNWFNRQQKRGRE